MDDDCHIRRCTVDRVQKTTGVFQFIYRAEQRPKNSHQSLCKFCAIFSIFNYFQQDVKEFIENGEKKIIQTKVKM